MNQNYRSQRNQRYSHNEELQAFATLKQAFHYLTQAALAPLLRFYRFLCYTIERPRDGRRIAGSWLFHNVFTFCNLLIVIWCWILFWGEVSVFSNSVEACTWGNWERWVRFTSWYQNIAAAQLISNSPRPLLLITSLSWQTLNWLILTRIQAGPGLYPH